MLIQTFNIPKRQNEQILFHESVVYERNAKTVKSLT